MGLLSSPPAKEMSFGGGESAGEGPGCCVSADEGPGCSATVHEGPECTETGSELGGYRFTDKMKKDNSISMFEKKIAT